MAGVIWICDKMPVVLFAAKGRQMLACFLMLYPGF